ncbi:MAG: tetratricopeptide repeat protein [Myxococcales bacterium]|nr:tetratricopeptide repeat protein [Myxococcales bacterium]MCB9580932.1 tetratricopeptide repeat protein [Polyangiaceae bacterium]
MTALAPLFRSRSQLVAATIAVVLLGGIGFLPLFGGPGYEAALAAGLVLPALGAVATAVEVASARPAPLDAYGRGLLSGFRLALLALLVTLAHGFRVGFCDPWDDIALFALGPGVGAVMGGAWGALVGLLAGARRRPRLWAVVLAFAGPVAGCLISLWRFFSSPMVFAFDPFFGFFAGPLYDTVITGTRGLLSYRAGSLATLLAGAALFQHLDERFGRRWGVILGGALAAAASLGITVAGGKLGHWSTVSTIAEELGRSVKSERCNVVYDAGIYERDARLFAEECSAHVRQIEAYFDAKGPDHVTAFLFLNEAQKGRLMGAQSTYIAKPWRREIYVQFARYPHPVVGHELAHVVSGAFAPGPFHVAGPLHGWIPDPGRIEGVAVAARPDEDDDLSLAEWARAMRDEKLLPPLSRVFRLSFLGENSATAYTVAGAFVAWFHDHYGARALREWYGGKTLPEVSGGKDLAQLEAEWMKYLDGVTLDDRARIAARARFDRPAIFGRQCPHVVDALAQEAGGKLGAGDHVGAEEIYQRVLVLDAHNFAARMGLAACASRAGDAHEARRRFQAIADDTSLTRLLRGSAEEGIADMDLYAGDVARARRGYRALEAIVANADHLRSLAVKSSTTSEVSRQAIVRLLIGDPELGRDFADAASWLGRWSELEPGDGTADYLLGRNLYNGGRYTDAAARLDAALARKLEIPEVAREALWMRAVVACARGHAPVARGAIAQYLLTPGLSASRRAGARAFAARCGAL